MPKTPDEIKKGMEITSSDCLMCECCVTDCPYDLECHPGNEETNTNVPKAMLHDALALIQQLQAQNAEKEARIQQLEADKQQLEGMLTHMNQLRDAAAGRALKMEERVHQLEEERDAAVEDVHGNCHSCKYYIKDPKEEPCASCLSGFGNKDNWQWRGVQKEE